MSLDKLFNPASIVELSFFNFRNAITAAFFADRDLRVQVVNDNFKSFFPLLRNVSNAWFPDILVQLGVDDALVESFQSSLEKDGRVLIPHIEIDIEGKTRVFSLMSTYTKDPDFPYLNGVQGQFVDRTDEYKLRHERELLLEEKLRDKELIEAKTLELERIANRLAKYLAPQIYQSIFEDRGDSDEGFKRKNLTIFFSDIVGFTDISDGIEPERLAYIINAYLSEMSAIAAEFGGTLDKFIGDAVLVFFGDPESAGESEDALRCVKMAWAMQKRIAELQSLWRSQGIAQPLRVRMGITTGYCTVGNFGSDQRLEYTALGGPVNLAARLQTRAQPDEIYLGESTWLLVRDRVACSEVESYTPKGFARPVRVYRVDSIDDATHVDDDPVTHKGEYVQIQINEPQNIRHAIEELRKISESLESQLSDKSSG